MKKLIVTIRLGTPGLLPKELPLGRKIVGDEDPEAAVGAPLGGVGFISIFWTGMSPTEIAELYRETAAATEDTLPVVVFELNSPQVGLDLEALDHFVEMRRLMLERFGGAPKEEPIKKRDLTLDELLDLIKERGGVQNLSDEEQAQLQKLSEN